MENERLKEVIDDGAALMNRCIERDGFLFTSILPPANVFDALVIVAPERARCASSLCTRIDHTLAEYIALVNQYQLEKALIIAENIDFITSCPSLKYLEIIPADSAPDHFHYAPLYAMPEVKSLACTTVYGQAEDKTTEIDYSRVHGLQSVCISSDGHKGYSSVPSLKSLIISGYPGTDLSGLSTSAELDTLLMLQSKIKSLRGVEAYPKLQCLYLHYNRTLQDISSLSSVRESLRALRIENCPQITDFSVLKKLVNLEHLELSGNNTLPSLDFLSMLPKLKTFLFSMNVADGDITPCLSLSYVYMERGRRHYNLKDRDLPKNQYVRGNENIEPWRRLQ